MYNISMIIVRDKYEYRDNTYAVPTLSHYRQVLIPILIAQIDESS